MTIDWEAKLECDLGEVTLQEIGDHYNNVDVDDGNNGEVSYWVSKKNGKPEKLLPDSFAVRNVMTIEEKVADIIAKTYHGVEGCSGCMAIALGLKASGFLREDK